MPYGTIKVDTITFTAGGVDTSVSISGLVQNPTFTGNITSTGTISGNIIQGGTTVSGATVTGTAGQFGTLTGNTAGFTTVTGTTITGTTANLVTVSGTTVTGGTARFTTLTGISGVFTTAISGATVTGNTGQFTVVTGGTAGFTTVTGTTVTGTTANFTTLSGTTAIITSGVFASGTAAAPSVSVGTTTNGLFSSGANEVAISTNGSGRLFVDANGNVGVGNSTPVNSADTSTISIGKSTTGGGQIEFKFNGAGRQYIFNSNTDLTFFNNNGATIFSNGSFERARITSTGLVGVGTSSVGALLHAKGTGGASSGAELLRLETGQATGGNWISFWDGTARKGYIGYKEITDENIYITNEESGGNVVISGPAKLGIGTSSPSSLLHLSVATAASDGTKGVRITNPAGTAAMFECGSSNDSYIGTTSGSDFSIRTNNISRIYVTNGGNVGIGTTSPAVRLHVDGDATTVIRVNGSSQGGAMAVQRAGSTTGIVGNLGTILGTTSSGLGLFAETGLDIRFFTNGSATEKARFNTTGDFAMGASVGTPGSYSNTGVSMGGDGYILASRSALTVLYLNRKTDDGNLVDFAQADTTEGSISVSGTTVSYNGAHLSRWSQLLGIDPHDKTQRPEILRGTVMSNLDEMCDWIDPESGESQDNEQLNKTKISDIEGDKNVAGVFQSWDDDDETWVNDYYLAVTGDFVIRIAGGVTVERGDLLMSAGDGTAKPQADDAVRSCTVAKVISTHISHTFDDGSYCVPCVLMAC